MDAAQFRITTTKDLNSNVEIELLFNSLFLFALQISLAQSMEPPLLRELLLTLHVSKERITQSPISQDTLETFAHLTTSATEMPVAMEASAKLTSTKLYHAKDRGTELVLLAISAHNKEIATTLFLLELCATQATL